MFFTVSTASITYTAVIRGKVALPCNIEPPTAGDEVVLVLWYKVSWNIPLELEVSLFAIALQHSAC